MGPVRTFGVSPPGRECCAWPAPGSPGEKQQFAAVQERLRPIFRSLFPDPCAPQTIVINPSMSLDEEELPKLEGACFYEERLLCLLMLLRRPGIRIVYLSSRCIDPAIIDYYLAAVGPCTPPARQRLTLLSCDDASPEPLSRKLLRRPELLERVRACIPDPLTAHMTCFNTTVLERTLAVRLRLPLYGCDPDLLHLGSKSGSRRIFREAGVAMPPGFGDLRDVHDVAAALHALKRLHPNVRRAVVKLNEGFSGDGNAMYRFDDGGWLPAAPGVILRDLPRTLRFVAPDECFDDFCAKFSRMGGIVEAFEEGDVKRSPSVQCRIDPLGTGRIVSTHDQILGGSDGQVFLGCAFPADPAYARSLHDAGMRVTRVMQQAGVIGRFSVDFVSCLRGGRWEHRALEINLRKGGTTHPFLALQLLTGGDYRVDEGVYRTATGAIRCYHASDNLGAPRFRGWTPRSLVETAARRRMHFDGATGIGVMFHLLGSVREHGKFGAVCVAGTRAASARLYHQLQTALSPRVGGTRRAPQLLPRIPLRRSLHTHGPLLPALAHSGASHWRTP